MPDNLLNQNLNNLEVPPEQAEINETNEQEFLKKIKSRNKKNLIKLDFLERERIARHIKSLYDEITGDQSKISDKIDEWDDVFRMVRASQSDADEESPNYRTPLSTVTLEVIHANTMNVFFSPKDIVRVLPTEAGDIPKIRKLDTFANWSMKNEMDLFANVDRLFHSSDKNGECPYIVYWVKEYGTEIKVEPVMNPVNPDEPLIDEETKEPITQEREKVKLLYNGPRFEVFSRKDYFLPKNATADKQPDWEMRRIRLDANTVRRNELEGKFYSGVFDEIGGWGTETPTTDEDKINIEGEEIPLGKTEKIFVEFYGRLRIKTIKSEQTFQKENEEFEELEDEFIGIMELNKEVLCSLKKNKFPLKMRPIGLDMFIPDDEGRLKGTGVMEFMESIQKANDALYNQYIFGTVQANNPFGFFTPTGNMRDEPIKTKSGYLYPTADPRNINIVQLPPPDNSLLLIMEKVENMAQVLFGISNYQAGIESEIDPRAPAEKAKLVVAQGNVRLNLILKRKNKTLKDIFKRWFLLYQANMPANKFMRIAGEDRNNPWKFEPINMTDFALKAIPDFELTGNILNANKTLEINKTLAIYRVLITNPFFSPRTTQGLQSLHALTKWMMDKLDEVGISNFLPSIPGDITRTPEEENARFLQGDKGEPEQGEDHVNHIRTHNILVLDPTVPDDVRKNATDHIAQHIDMMRQAITRQMVLAQTPSPRVGEESVAGAGQTAIRTPESVFPIEGLGRPQGGIEAGII